MPSRQLAVVLASLVSFIAVGCGSGDAAAPPQAKGADPPDTAAAAPSRAATPAAATARKERPLPAFGGYTLDGQRLESSSFVGKRTLLFFFNPEVDEVRVIAKAIASLDDLQDRHNFRIAGIAIGSDGDTARNFASEVGFEFPIIDDSSGRITSKLRLRSRVLIIGTDAEGYMMFAHSAFGTQAPNAAGLIELELRNELRIPPPSPPSTSALMARTPAPPFSTPAFDGGDFHLAEHRGRPVILIFFLHTCPHCHHALNSLKEVLPKIPEERRPALYGISIVDRPSAVRSALREEDLDFFPVLRDPGEKVRTLYGAFSGVPDLVFIDADGDIAYRSVGWRDRDEALVKMQVYKLAGEKIPMLLARTGYTGNDVCGVCHELEQRAWEYTQHATAYDTLVTHGVERDAECVSCHVVGFGQPGGFDMNAPEPYLEDVGCESCHGRGGPHLSPDFVKGGQYAPVCETCHNPTHSLGFDYATFRPRISHTGIAALSPEARAKLVADGAKPRDVLPTQADHVGSDACQSCHEAEFATWAASPHGHALASLESQGEQDNTDCLRCHTTAFGKPGGFPAEGAPADHADLARVGCESCHGPGGDHVAEGATRRGTIVSLGDKCDSCVILQICGSCHDPANDKDFEFSVQEHIDRQRHGTIEAGTGKPLDETSAALQRLRSGAATALANLSPAPERAGP